MTRFDLYTHPHKAVRIVLFDAVAALGRTDFGREFELPATLATVRRALRLARRHAEHEDREIHPLLHRLAPELAADLEAGHERFDGMDREIERCLARLEVASAAERVSLGARVQRFFGERVAHHLEHMLLEESRANRVLWAHASDAELEAVQERILASIEPAERAEWIQPMLRAGNRIERAGLVAALRACLPVEPLILEGASA